MLFQVVEQTIINEKNMCFLISWTTQRVKRSVMYVPLQKHTDGWRSITKSNNKTILYAPGFPQWRISESSSLGRALRLGWKRFPSKYYWNIHWWFKHTFDPVELIICLANNESLFLLLYAIIICVKWIESRNRIWVNNFKGILNHKIRA